MGFYLGIDLGTSYFKAGIFDGNGHLKGLGRQPVSKVTDGIRCELPTDIFLQTIRTCLDEASRQAGIPTDAIRSLSYASQTNSFILLDAHDEPLTPLILWPDKRASGMEPPLGNTFELMQRTGLGVTPDAQFTVAKLNWFRQNRPDVWKKTACILSVSDYLTFVLTGQKAADYSTASMSGLFDIVNSTWWEEQLENCGIEAGMLPTPQRTGTFVGVTTAKAADLTGLPQDIPFCLGGLDHHIAAIGAGILSNGYISESTGTVISCVDYTDAWLPQKGVCMAPGLHDGRFFRLMFDENGASSLERYQKNHASEYSIAELLNMASQADMPANPHGYHVRAILESTARSLRQMVVEIKKDVTVPAIVASGGGSRSELWVEIMSAIVQVPFFIPECTELSCMGAAMTGALGINAFVDYDTLADTWIRFRKKIRCV
jgi:sugar (pentulose or hexulose) kinase